MDQLTALRVFARVAETESFSEAARRLGLSKSAVSKHVSMLEDHLGAKLLYRTTRRVSLTEEGQGYLSRIIQVLDDLEEADGAVSALRSDPRGTLRVNAALSFGLRHLGPALVDFHRHYPQVTVDLDLTDRFVDLLQEGVDVAIRIGELSDSSLIARRLTSTRLICLAAPSYLKRHGEPRTVADLASHQCLRYRGRRSPAEWALTPLDGGPEETARVEGPVIANNGDVLVQAAVAGLGIYQSPDFMAYEAIARGDLVPILTHYETPVLPVHAVYPPNRHLSARVRAFIDHLAEWFRTPPWEN